MGGKMLAINEGFGYRPVMVVQSFNFIPQYQDRLPSTWVWGMQLMTVYDDPTEFLKFLTPFMGQTLLWDQLGIQEDDTIEMVYAIWPKIPIRVVMEEPLTILSAGKDPLRGYYVQFAGPMRLFSQPDWWRDGNEVQY